MSQPFLGEIRCFGFNFAPFKWAFCNGQVLPISQYSALFSLLGTFYGGNGTSTFALPNLQGQVPMHWGDGTGLTPTEIGEAQGTTTVSLIQTEMPLHNHPITTEITEPGGAPERTNAPTVSAFIGPSDPDAIYKAAPTLNSTFAPSAIGPAGNGLPHKNMQPYLVLNFCIALAGIFPSRN